MNATASLRLAVFGIIRHLKGRLGDILHSSSLAPVLGGLFAAIFVTLSATWMTEHFAPVVQATLGAINFMGSELLSAFGIIVALVGVSVVVWEARHSERRKFDYLMHVAEISRMPDLVEHRLAVSIGEAERDIKRILSELQTIVEIERPSSLIDRSNEAVALAATFDEILSNFSTAEREAIAQELVGILAARAKSVEPPPAPSMRQG